MKTRFFFSRLSLRNTSVYLYIFVCTREVIRFLEGIDGNFLLQMTEEPMRRGAILDFIMTYNER